MVLLYSRGAFLGATPDGHIYCPSLTEPHSFLEVKCPCSQRDVIPVEACGTPGFCCVLGDNRSSAIKLCRTHRYYAQVQGQMAIGGRKWCDFVIYTKKGIAVEWIAFDPNYWSNQLLPKFTRIFLLQR